MNSESSAQKEYIISLLTEYTILKKKHLSVAKELKLWKSREELAEKKGEEGLKKIAGGKKEALEKKLYILTEEKDKLKRELDREKGTLKSLIEKSNRAPDPEELIHTLQDLAGEDTELKNQFSNLSIDNELKRIKREMEN